MRCHVGSISGGGMEALCVGVRGLGMLRGVFSYLQLACSFSGMRLWDGHRIVAKSTYQYALRVGRRMVSRESVRIT